MGNNMARAYNGLLTVQPKKSKPVIAAIRVEPENITLNEMSQTQKDKHQMFLLTCECLKKKS
jgi:hypothetical protein